MPTQSVIQFSGKAINKTQVVVSFTLFPGSNAAELGCYVAVWQGSEICTSAEAVQKHVILTQNHSGEITLDNLLMSGQDYVIGLGLHAGSIEETIYSCLKVDAGSVINKPLTAILSNVSVSSADIGTDFLVAKIESPNFDEVKIDQGWIALFPGKYKETMKDGINVVAISNTTVGQHPEKIIMKNIPNGLSRFETYTIIYGVGLNQANEPDYQKMIGTYTFIVWRSKIYIHTYLDLPLFPTLCIF
jgi:hypothetical protein